MALLIAAGVAGGGGDDGEDNAKTSAGSVATDSPSPKATATPTPTRTVTPGPGSVLALLETLPVKGRAPRTGYSREAFGQAWADTDRNGCDTRNDILRRDLPGAVIKPGTNGCVVLSGKLADPYTAQIIMFVRGGDSQVDIDHVVSLSDAWQTGAFAWPSRKRLAFANDPLNLLAVDAAANRQKGDSNAASWLPPSKASRCAYI
ncbi:MAG TPA: HNH endonuclease family protein, partial [Kribbellaceae bacterium]